MNAAPIHLGAYWALLRTNRNFRLLWSAQFISEIGDWLYSVAIYSLLLEVTGSAKAVALAFVLQVLPQFFVAPAAGILSDRISRKKVMIIADCTRAVTTVLMLFAQSREMLWFLYVLLLLETIFWALFEPARTAVIPSICGSTMETLIANGLSSMTWSFTLAMGASVGGMLAAYFGRDTVFILDAFSFIASATLIKAMVFKEPHTEHRRPLRPRDLVDFAPILEGIRYVRQDVRRMSTMFVKAGIGLMGTNWVLLPIFGERIFPLAIGEIGSPSGGMLSMSLLMGSRGVGSLAGPLLAGYWTGTAQHRFRFGITIGFIVGAIGYFALSQSPTLALACASVIVAHSGGAMAWVFSTTLLQMQTADEFRGRVFSAEYAFSMLTLSVVSYSAGVLADTGVSVRTIAMMTSGVVLIPAILWAYALRFWRN